MERESSYEGPDMGGKAALFEGTVIKALRSPRSINLIIRKHPCHGMPDTMIEIDCYAMCRRG